MIQIKHLSKSYDSKHILSNICMEIKKSEVVSLIGPSGSGKSTLLRCVNRLVDFNEGSIFVNGIDISDPKQSIEKIRQNMGMVFQGFHLFPHKTVLENISLAPILLKSKDKDQAVADAQRLLQRIGLLDKQDDYPQQLSGGQQQRVAIARTLVMDPQILLFDEPTSALDPEMVQEILTLIKDLLKDGLTMLIVTHEINFAQNISDRIFFMDQGKIVEEGSPSQVLSNSKEERTKIFLKKVLNHF